jgi:3-dehydroquinate dehydratase-1
MIISTGKWRSNVKEFDGEKMRPCLSTPLMIRQKQFGGEKGLFCVPLVAGSQDELLEQARTVSVLHPDVVEWRSDFYSDLGQSSISDSSGALRAILGDALLLFTLRAKAEGGNQELASTQRVKCVEVALKTRDFDLVDVELSSGPDVIKPVIALAHECDARAILSFHDFEGTPGKEALLAKISAMIESGADIAKVACMPRNPGDVLRLLEVTFEARQSFPTVPLCTMSMGGIGCLSRVAGFLFGSDMAFAVGDKVSAPGQIPIEEARRIAATFVKYI